MTGQVESAIDTLLSNHGKFDTMKKICTGCGGYKPLPTKKCHVCRNNEFVQHLCGRDLRVAELLKALKSARVWPVSSFVGVSPIEYSNRTKVIVSHIQHECNENGQCPLICTVDTLKTRVDEVMTRPASFDLKSFQEKHWSQ